MPIGSARTWPTRRSGGLRVGLRYPCTHVRSSIGMRARTHARVHSRTQVRLIASAFGVCTHAHMDLHAYVRTRTCTCVLHDCPCPRTLTHAYARTRSHTRAYACMRTHTHVDAGMPTLRMHACYAGIHTHSYSGALRTRTWPRILVYMHARACLCIPMHMNPHDPLTLYTLAQAYMRAHRRAYGCARNHT